MPRQRNLILLAGCACVLASACAHTPQQSTNTSISPPPDEMAINYKGIGSTLGYVVSLGYFSEAEMNDPLWEFARTKRATMRWCKSEARLRQRDVRWVPTNDGSGQKCAMVVYTSECLEPREVKDRVDSRFSNSLERDRQLLLTEPVRGPSGSACGQKDRALIRGPNPQ